MFYQGNDYYIYGDKQPSLDGTGGNTDNVFTINCESTAKVGDWIYIYSNNNARLAIADESTPEKTEVKGIITEKLSSTSCIVKNIGKIDKTGLINGSYWLSQTIPGTMISTRPVSGVIKEVGFAVSAIVFYVNVSTIITIKN